MSDDLMRRRALRAFRNDPESAHLPEEIGVIHHEVRERQRVAAAKWDELFVNVAVPDGMEVLFDDDGNTAYTEHPVEIQRLCRVVVPRSVAGLALSLIVAQGQDG